MEGSRVTDSLETEVFRISQGKFLRYLMARKALWFMSSVGVLLVGSLVLGVWVDLRIFILALMAVFIVIPFMMFMLYWSYALSPLNAANVLPHKLILSDAGLIVSVLKSKPKEEEKKEKEDNGEEGREAAIGKEEEHQEWFEMEFPSGSYGNVVLTGDGFALTIEKDGKTGSLLIPRRAFSFPDAFQQFLNKL